MQKPRTVLRRALALGLALYAIGLAFALASCGDSGGSSEEASPGVDAQDTPQDPEPGDALDTSRPAYRTSAECGRCHTAIYAEYIKSYHGRAMIDPLFRELSAEVNKEECIRCHAPVNLRDSGFQIPIARSELRDDAISCLSCHQNGGHVSGPFGGMEGAPCRPVQDPDQTDVVKMCFVCHNQHDTGNEWLAGPYSPEAPEPRQRDAQTCIDCHMPVVERPLVKGGPVRKSHRHTWFGGHSRTQLEKAAAVDVEVGALPDGGHRFRIYVTNKGAGHSIPTDARHRSFDTYLLLRDTQGKVILDPTDPQQQDRAHLAKFRKFYRGSGKKDTQIPPLVRTSTRGEGLGYLDVPEASSGTGEAWLVYRLTPRDVLNKRSLTAGTAHDIKKLWLARVIVRVEFTYGP